MELILGALYISVVGSGAASVGAAIFRRRGQRKLFLAAVVVMMIGIVIAAIATVSLIVEVS